MFRLVEKESREVLVCNIVGREEADNVKERYENGDMVLGIFTEDFYDIEEY